LAPPFGEAKGGRNCFSDGATDHATPRPKSIDLDQISTLPIIPEAEEQNGHPRESQDGISPTPVRIFIRHW